MSSYPACATRRSATASRKASEGRPTTASGAGEIITLTREGQFTRIEPAVNGLGDVFYTVQHAVEDDQNHGWKMSPWKAPLVSLQTTPDIQYQMCGVGLEPLVAQHLRQCGYKVRKRGPRPGRLPSPSRRNLGRLRRVDPPLLTCIRQHERAVIRCRPTTKHLTQVVLQLALAWPEINIVVVVSPDHDALRPDDCLRDLLLEVYPGDDDSLYGVQVGDVWEGDYADAARWLKEIEGLTILLVPEPAKFLRTKAGREVLYRAHDARLYGLLPSEARLTPSERDEITAYFGVNDVDVGEEDAAGEPVEVALVRNNGGPRLKTKISPLELMRRGVWHNPVRNLKIAQLARALVDHDEEQLQTYFPGVWRALAGEPAGRVGILVENVEHALVLAKSLPGWPVVTSLRLWDEGLTRRERGILRAGRDELLRTTENVVVTTEGLPYAGQLDVLIRADAAAGLSHKPINVNRIMVDLDDRHHPVLQKRAKQRRQGYLAQGWSVGDKTKEDDPLEWFQTTRPRLEGTKGSRGRR